MMMAKNFQIISNEILEFKTTGTIFKQSKLVDENYTTAVRKRLRIICSNVSADWAKSMKTLGLKGPITSDNLIEEEFLLRHYNFNTGNIYPLTKFQQIQNLRWLRFWLVLLFRPLTSA